MYLAVSLVDRFSNRHESYKGSLVSLCHHIGDDLLGHIAQ